MLDATMNYAGFAKPVGYWLNRFHVNQHAQPNQVESIIPWSTQALVDSWQANRAAIPWVIACQQFNLLGSHDTARIINTLDHNQALNRLAVALLMTYVGTPCIYYGDEIGMSGRDSLEARNCMNWDTRAWNQDLRTFYQVLTKLRRSSPALIEGGFQVLEIEENSLAYLRDSEEEQIIVIGSRTMRPHSPLRVDQGGIQDGAIFSEIFSGQTCQVVNGRLPVPTLQTGVQIWRGGRD
jgi:alpha-glucosidase